MFCICQILEKKWKYSEAVYQLFIDFKKAYDSVRSCHTVIDGGPHSAIHSIEFKSSLFASPGIIFKKDKSVSAPL
jgi:hypothetical protein